MTEDEQKIQDAINEHLFDLGTPDTLDQIRTKVADKFGIHPDSVAATLIEDGSIKIDIPDRSFTVGISIPFS
jgi:hypothetical protein